MRNIISCDVTTYENGKEFLEEVKSKFNLNEISFAFGKKGKYIYLSSNNEDTDGEIYSFYEKKGYSVGFRNFESKNYTEAEEKLFPKESLEFMFGLPIVLNECL